MLSKDKNKVNTQQKNSQAKPPKTPGFHNYDGDITPEANFAENLKTQKSFCAGNGNIYCWSSWYWANTEDMQADWAKRQAARYFESFAPDRLTSKTVSSAVEVAKLTLPPLPSISNSTGSTIIPLKGTWLEVRPDGSIHYKAPDQKLGITYALKVSLAACSGEYTPPSLPEGSKFKDFLDTFMPNPEHQKVLQEYTGYTLTPNAKHQKALMLQGEGGEGKSAFIEMVSGLHHRVEVFDVNSTDARKPASLADATLIICPEVGRKNFQLEFFKSLVAGDKVQLRNLYKDQVSVVLGAKCIFSFNNFPIVNDKTNGFWRRVILFKLTNKISADKVNVNLPAEILATERHIVLNWALEGLQRLTRQKDFTRVPELELGIEEWKASHNTVKQFTDEFELALHPTNYFLKVDLYQRYRQFCADRGHFAGSNESFYADLKRLFPNLLEKKVTLNGERLRAVFCELKALNL